MKDLTSKYIVIEGPIGVGKTSLSNKLALEWAIGTGNFEGGGSIRIWPLKLPVPMAVLCQFLWLRLALEVTSVSYGCSVTVLLPQVSADYRLMLKQLSDSYAERA